MSNVTTLVKKDPSGKKIELLHYIDNDSDTIVSENDNGTLELNDATGIFDNVAFDNICLISKGRVFDVIACWDNDEGPDNVIVYLGHWNSGTL